LSIPDEPIDGDIIRINFRCPNGSAISRNFANNEKLDLLYHWVETN
jgi:dihydroorotate dehydrogenase